MKWLDDQPSSAFRKSVLAAAELELLKHRPAVSRRWLIWRSVAAAGFAAVAGVVFFRQRDHGPAADLDVVGADPAMVSEYEFYQDLELWENLSLFENWPEEES